MEPIAIIGIGCRFPGAKNPEAFWQLLQNGVDAIVEVPKERWDIDQFYDAEPGKPGKMSTRWGGFVEQVDQFDPAFFGISPREVERMDPQQRFVLEVAWEAIENAGIAPDSLSGSQTGVFMGIGNYDYCRLLARDITQANAYDGTGNTLSIAANRLSYLLNLRGPSVLVETACSSSLVAVHFACRSLQSGESDLCLVGGASLMLSPDPFITYSHARMMAADGRCKTFDARADGYVRGEGCGVVLLKRLSDAQRDGDNIQAVIQGTAMNQDGLSNGLTAPNGPAQQAVIRQALRNAGVAPSEISYVEAHGTGTSLGDPIEFKSLKAVLMQDRPSDRPCWLGSVKTNIGHLEAASGIASIIKVVLSLQHREIPPHLHLQQLNPYISLEGTTFSIPTTRQHWAAGTDRRFAGISAFGFGGTNCHMILAESPAQFKLPVLSESAGDGLARSSSAIPGFDREKSEIDRFFHLLTLSTKNEAALKDLAQAYRDFLTVHSETSLADICFTANTGRSHFEHRLAVVSQTPEQLQEQLEAFLGGEQSPGVMRGQLISKKRPKVAFLFTGQGSQYINMGRQLYETQPVFRQAIDRCDQILQTELQQSLLSVLYPDLPGVHPAAAQPSLLDETAYTQPALFAVEYALAQLWQSWGVEPAIGMGHSVGEYVAACLAGVFSLEDGLKLIAARARLMQALPQDGAMVAVFANEAQVQTAIAPYPEVAIAAFNGPRSLVISGKRSAVEAAITALQADGVKAKPLNVSHAFHAPAMEPILAEFERVAAAISYGKPQFKLISNVTGTIATDEIATPQYWCRHIRQAVRFAQGIETLHQQGYELFVEIGPRPTLAGMGRACLPEGAGVWLPSLYPGRDEWQQILQSLASLYVRGVAIDWSRFDQPYSRRRLSLPTYPFQRQRYWAKAAESHHWASLLQPDPQTESPALPPLNLLNQGNAQSIIQRLSGTLSPDELQLLPKLLDLLAQPIPALAADLSPEPSSELFPELSADSFIEPSIQDWLYEVEWQLQPRQTIESGSHRTQNGSSPNQSVSAGSWLIFADPDGVGESIAAQLRLGGYACTLVYPGETFQTPSQSGAADTWSLNPTCAADFDRLFQAVLQPDSPVQGILHLWSLAAPAPEALSLTSLEQAQRLTVGSVLHLLQALVKTAAQVSCGSPQLWLLTQGAMPVGRSSRTAVAQSTLWGLGKVVALEHPELWGGLIDLAPDVGAADLMALLTEITRTQPENQREDQLAFRSGQRYVARLVRKPCLNARSNCPSNARSGEPVIRATATYLITGGLGALGLRVAAWMVQQGARHLVLTGRRAASAAADETLNQLEQAGAKILVFQADIAEEGDVVKLLEAIEALLPPLRGVIHAAGVLDDGILLQQTWERSVQVMHPKVKGAWNLHCLTQSLPLDFFVGFSSAAALLGSPGQGNYAAANAFLDGLAQYRRSIGLPGLSINWGAWSDTGMAANLDERSQARLAAQGLQPIAPEAGLRILAQLLGQPIAQVGVVPFEWATFQKQFSKNQALPLLRDLLSQVSLTASIAPPSEFLRQIQQTPPNQRRERVVAYLQQQVVQVMQLTTAEVSPNESLHLLGLDSLMAVELAGSIRSQLQIELPIRAFIEDPSIASLATLIIEQLTPGQVSVEIEEDRLNLQAEAMLDPAISPDNAALPMVDQPTAILLTGATGFLGAFLLQELLEQTAADIYCLVRSPDLKSARIRLQENLKTYDLWQEQFCDRIVPILGDLGQPLLGLSLDQFDQLARQIDSIYHNGALLNYVYPYSKFKPINVQGTEEILRLACQTKIKPVHHISSVAVFESSAYYGKRIDEADPIDRSEDIYLGYSQSKWVSEKLVQIAGERGLPITIHRPPLVSGHSQTGLWNSDGFLCRMIKGCIQMGSIMTDLDLMLDLSPVDYNSRAIVYLSRQKESIGKAFHLQNPQLLHWNTLVDFICAMGYPMRRVSFAEWQLQLSQEKQNPLYPLLPFFSHQWGKDKLTYIQLNEQGRRPLIDCEATLTALKGTSIVCPSLDSELLNTYFAYFIRSGFLEAPQSQLAKLTAS